MKAAGPLNLPSVRDEGPVSVRRDTNSPEAAGFMRAAQARASGGEAIARGVQAFAAGIDKMAEDRDRAKALAAYNDYVTKSSELLYNADSGFMNAQGAGAEGLAYRVNEAHNTLRGEVAEGLSSRQRRLFMESAASYDRDVARSAMRYEGRAMAEYRREYGCGFRGSSRRYFYRDAGGEYLFRHDGAFRGPGRGGERRERQERPLRFYLKGGAAYRGARPSARRGFRARERGADGRGRRGGDAD